MSEITSFRPFRAFYVHYSGDYDCLVTFTCGKCGSHNVTKRSDKHFFQGHFSCSDCGYSDHGDGYPYFYASPCFHIVEIPRVTQLTLF